MEERLEKKMKNINYKNLETELKTAAK
jgi:hypothetical protein